MKLRTGLLLGGVGLLFFKSKMMPDLAVSQADSAAKLSASSQPNEPRRLFNEAGNEISEEQASMTTAAVFDQSGDRIGTRERRDILFAQNLEQEQSTTPRTTVLRYVGTSLTDIEQVNYTPIAEDVLNSLMPPLALDGSRVIDLGQFSRANNSGAVERIPLNSLIVSDGGVLPYVESIGAGRILGSSPFSSGPRVRFIGGEWVIEIDLSARSGRRDTRLFLAYDIDRGPRSSMTIRHTIV